MYEKTTHDISISVTPEYLEDQSAPEDNHYVWAYHVKIENKGQQEFQLKSRYWRIIDAAGHTEEVCGQGVIGEQPYIKPGDIFEYTSGAPLRTPGGLMLGSYKMARLNETKDEDRLIDVDIPAFSLDSPYQTTILN